MHDDEEVRALVARSVTKLYETKNTRRDSCEKERCGVERDARLIRERERQREKKKTLYGYAIRHVKKVLA